MDVHGGPRGAIRGYDPHNVDDAKNRGNSKQRDANENQCHESFVLLTIRCRKRTKVTRTRGIVIFDLVASETLIRAQDPDAPVVERILGGEARLYEILMRRYNQRLYRVARAILHTDSEVEDVMQEAYLKAFTSLPRFQGKALFSTWLTRILVNCALTYRRSRSRHPELDLEAVAGTIGRDTTDRAELAISQEQIKRLIEMTLDTLPPTYRVVFVMRELEGMSVAETAAGLGISQVNAKVRLHRAKQLLRLAIQRQMPDISVYGFLGERCDAFTRRVMEKILPQDRTQGELPGASQPGA